MTSNPYSDYGESPIGGYMRGFADVVRTLTTGMMDEQRSHLMRPQVQRERMENQRRELVNWLYSREKMPTAEDDRQRDLALQVHRALNNPPLGDIYSGRAMNVLLDDLSRKPGKDSAVQIPIKLDDVAAHINFTRQGNKGNPAILKFVHSNEGRLPWPAVLAGPQYTAERDQIDLLARTLCKEAQADQVAPSNLESMSAATRKLLQSLNAGIRDLTPSEYGEARRFLGDLEDAIILLGQPNARDCFGARAPKADTMSDLVQQMLSRGLRFAPATAGDEAVYVAVHRALASYASNVTGMAADKLSARGE
jgi:hypothetical protein